MERGGALTSDAVDGRGSRGWAASQAVSERERRDTWGVQVPRVGDSASHRRVFQLCWRCGADPLSLCRSDASSGPFSSPKQTALQATERRDAAGTVRNKESMHVRSNTITANHDLPSPGPGPPPARAGRAAAYQSQLLYLRSPPLRAAEDTRGGIVAQETCGQHATRTGGACHAPAPPGTLAAAWNSGGRPPSGLAGRPAASVLAPRRFWHVAMPRARLAPEASRADTVPAGRS
jgi:hypothetical protein